MRDRLIELLKKSQHLDVLFGGDDEYAKAADRLLANGVIVPPCKVEPIITVIKKPFHNRIEVVKNTRYEWNEARFCFSEDEANRVEAEW